MTNLIPNPLDKDLITNLSALCRPRRPGAMKFFSRHLCGRQTTTATALGGDSRFQKHATQELEIAAISPQSNPRRSHVQTRSTVSVDIMTFIH